PGKAEAFDVGQVDQHIDQDNQADAQDQGPGNVAPAVLDLGCDVGGIVPAAVGEEGQDQGEGHAAALEDDVRRPGRAKQASAGAHPLQVHEGIVSRGRRPGQPNHDDGRQPHDLDGGEDVLGELAGPQPEDIEGGQDHDGQAGPDPAEGVALVLLRAEEQAGGV